MERFVNKEACWYLPNKDSKDPFGPFLLTEIIAKYNEGKLKFDDYIWSENFKDDKWIRLYEVQELHNLLVKYPRYPTPPRRSKGQAQVKKVEVVTKRKGEYGSENVYRRYPRAPIEMIVILHNNDRYLEARCVDISEKGTFLHVPLDSGFEAGEHVTITVVEHPLLGTCSLPSVIIYAAQKESFRGLGIYFLRVNPNVKQRIAHYVVEKLKEAENVESKVDLGESA